MKRDKQNRLSSKQKAMIAALEKTLGIVTTACKIADVGRRTHYDWMDNSEKYAEAVHDVDDMALDYVESQHYKHIKEGKEASTIFHLKTKGKRRGYIEKQEVEHTGAVPVTVVDDI